MAILDWVNFEKIHGLPGGAREAFENVCLDLVRKKYEKDSAVHKIKPSRGDHGIDIYVNDIGVEPIHIYQCKYFRSSLGAAQQNQIRESFKTIVLNENYEVSEWTLLLPLDMTYDENIWWSKFKNRMNQKIPKLDINCLCGQALIQELIDYDLYEKYFGDSFNKVTNIETSKKAHLIL